MNGTYHKQNSNIVGGTRFEIEMTDNKKNERQVLTGDLEHCVVVFVNDEPFFLFLLFWSFSLTSNFDHLSHGPIVEVADGRDVSQAPWMLLLDETRFGCVIIECHGWRR
jgi:hypothetical protein